MSDMGFSQINRLQNLKNLNAEIFDVLVIGGGITGAGVARDAAMRGLSVALIEAQDFASGTSSRSSKMIHGGLRYLVSGDISVVKESALERRILHRIAPHLAKKTPYVIPTSSSHSKWILRTALWAYESLGNVEKADYHEVWSRDELKDKEPLIDLPGSNGAIIYPEYLTDDSRLTVANLRSSVDHGASVSSYLKAIAIRRDTDFSIEAKSTLPGDQSTGTIRAKTVVNASGPWVDEVCNMEVEQNPRLALSRGVHVVFDHNDIPVQRTVVMRTQDRRRIFAVPLGEYTYLGTTDDFHFNSEYWPPVDQEDINYLLKGTEKVMPSLSLSPNNIISVWSGIRPLVGDGSGRATKELSRKDEIWISPNGMLSVGGGKLSAYRAMAERVVDQLIDIGDFTVKPCRTGDEPLPGGERVVDPSTLKGQTKSGAERLARLYGTEAQSIIECSQNDFEATTIAEARHAVMSEGALRLEDYWARRSSRAWFDFEAGLPVLKVAAATMGELLDWDSTRIAVEVENCRNIDSESRASFLNSES